MPHGHQTVVALLAGALVSLPAVTVSDGAQAKRKCHPSYKGKCLKMGAGDYDCIGGSGDGPNYTGRVRVVGTDVFRLDADKDGVGCE